MKQPKEVLTEYMESFWVETEPNPMDRKSRIYEDMWLEVYPFDGRIHLGFMMTMDQGQGNAHRAMELLTNLADDYEVEMELFAKATGKLEGKMTTAQLVKFYEQYGFVQTRPGRVSREGETMRREPEGARENPFLTKPPVATYKGTTMKGVHSHPGFHTSENRDIVMPYAQAKAEHSPNFVDDYPVILGFDMSGLEYLADYDADKAFERIRDYYFMRGGLDSFEEFMNASYDFEEGGYYESEDYPLTRLRPGAIGTDILFSRESAYHRPEEKFAQWVISNDDEEYQEELFHRLKNEDFPSKKLAWLLEQRRYVDDVPDDRLVVVYYMKPVWPLLEWPWHDESSQAIEYFIQSLEDNGWTVYTTTEIEEDPYDLRAPSIKTAWRRIPKKRMYGLQYHGTSYQNLITAAPWLKDKLPTPPSPYGRSINFEEDALEFTRSMMPGFRIEYDNGYIEAVDPEDIEEE